MAEHDDPLRLYIKKAISSALKTITPDNGYRSDLSDLPPANNGGAPLERVQRGRLTWSDNEPWPGVAVNEHPNALDVLLAGEDGSAREGDWDLMIQGFVKDAPLNPSDAADILVAEVIQRLVQEGQRKLHPTDRRPTNILGVGGLVHKLVIRQQIVRPADGVISDTSYFWLTVTLGLVENLETPFAYP